MNLWVMYISGAAFLVSFLLGIVCLISFVLNMVTDKGRVAFRRLTWIIGGQLVSLIVFAVASVGYVFGRMP